MSGANLRRRLERLEAVRGVDARRCPACGQRDPEAGELSLADALAVLEAEGARPAGLPEGEPMAEPCERCGRPVMTLAAARAVLAQGPPELREDETR